ncbi:hypothetical protein GMOD_00008702 [Pyrenophora seminiperda CCB06]|uniref:Uncharacterized protein n=1 Tax=Pyrenophora seminiperda CCB06 TaxID=1302712 RepID=A0A3M7M5Q5_9PLEO|nr:hypothetical protein GMOD_00008702 [Pyrenophora seminiperda CCB06]
MTQTCDEEYEDAQHWRGRARHFGDGDIGDIHTADWSSPDPVKSLGSNVEACLPAIQGKSNGIYRPDY